MSSTLSDYNVNELFVTTRTSIVSKRKQYSDLDLSLALNLNFRDIVPYTDIDAVKNSVRNLILSNYFDRPFQPALGSNVTAFLFEPADNFTISAMREEIKRVLKKFEPRVDDVVVEIIDNSDKNAYNITIGFRVIALDQRIDLTLYLKRIR